MTLLAPLRIEAAAVRAGARGRRIERIGMGPARAGGAGARLRRLLAPGAPVAVLGFAGGLHATDRAGDLVVATELFTTDDSMPPAMLDGALAGRIAAALAKVLGRVRTGPIACCPTLMPAREVAEVAADRAVACEMESAWLAPLAGGRPFAVVRVIVDRPGRPLVGPWTISGGIVAWRRLAIAAGIVAGELEQYK
ncbi:MAG: 1-hydroxy-2-methyl-2-butenyl 4-diphosphate reductase [Acidimicrobiales bacterium]